MEVVDAIPVTVGEKSVLRNARCVKALETVQYVKGREGFEWGMRTR